MPPLSASEVDALLPFLLQRQNVARYEEGDVLIGDRRRYPFAREMVRCRDVEEVARAIEEMVTQGGGPWVAAAFALAMTARRVAGQSAAQQMAQLEQARARLVRTRPTNTALARRLEAAIQVGREALAAQNGAATSCGFVEQALLAWIDRARTRIHEHYGVTARYGADLIADGDGILTMCFAESAFMLSLALAWREGKRISVFAPETRPYLQGARLTAPSIHELGIPVQIIGDNMPAYVMSQGKVQKYFTAADLVTLDGHVVNKIGTFQNAIAAHHHAIPFFVFSWGPDKHKPDHASIEIEERDPAEMKMCQGQPTTLPVIEAYYPAFDITPPHLVAGIITEHGVLSPYDLPRYFG